MILDLFSRRFVGWAMSERMTRQLTLFDDVFSPYARKVRIAFYEKRIPFERVRFTGTVTGLISST